MAKASDTVFTTSTVHTTMSPTFAKKKKFGFNTCLARSGLKKKRGMRGKLNSPRLVCHSFILIKTSYPKSAAQVREERKPR